MVLRCTWEQAVIAGGPYIVFDVCAPRIRATPVSPRPVHGLSWLLKGRRHKRRCRRHPRPPMSHLRRSALSRSRTRADLCAFCTAAVWFGNNFRVALAHNHLIRWAPVSGSVSLDPDFSLRHVNRAGGPDLDRVQPRVLRVVGCQRRVLPELKDRRPFLRNRHAVGS